MRVMLYMLAATLLILAAGAFYFSRDSSPLSASVDIATALASDTTGYTRALRPIPIRFPRDHGPHPDFKLEWWYYTGNLATDSGRRFGYQFTIFRNALAPPDSANDVQTSSWRSDQLYLAHFTVSDIDDGAFYASERFSRGAAGLAGAQADPFKVWIDDWTAEQVGSNMPPMRVRAEQDGVSLDLTLDLLKPIVLQGDSGYSVKGPGVGNASYYYSMTRLHTEGTVTVNGQSHSVVGLSWMDREWSTSLLTEDQVGWDWFSLQLDDGRDMMYFVVRNKEGQPGAYTDGALFGIDGSKRTLTPEDVQLEVLDTWQSPRDASYPSRWRLRVPAEALDLEIQPHLNDQELDVSVRYWEGAVRVAGTAAGKPVSGHGYVELTGYDGAFLN